MAEFPSMPLWTDAYLADTSHLTTIEHGAYLLLLMVMWRTSDKRLPDDDKKLARYARMTVGQWKRISPTLREFFKVENGYLYQSRLTDEANAVRQYRDRQAAAGRASALKRKERHSTTVQPEGNQKATPTPTPTPKVIEPKGSCASGDTPEDDFTMSDFVESWNDVAAKCGLARIAKVTDARRRAFNVRKRQYPDIDDWKKAFRCLAENKWMHGDNANGWRADADFFLQAKSFTKLVEGAYAKADR